MPEDFWGLVWKCLWNNDSGRALKAIGKRLNGRENGRNRKKSLKKEFASRHTVLQLKDPLYLCDTHNTERL